MPTKRAVECVEEESFGRFRKERVGRIVADTRLETEIKDASVRHEKVMSTTRKQHEAYS